MSKTLLNLKQPNKTDYSTYKKMMSENQVPKIETILEIMESRSFSFNIFECHMNFPNEINLRESCFDIWNGAL